MRIFAGAIAAAFAVVSVAAMRPDMASAQSAPPALTKVVFSLDFIPLGRHDKYGVHRFWPEHLLN